MSDELNAENENMPVSRHCETCGRGRRTLTWDEVKILRARGKSGLNAQDCCAESASAKHREGPSR